MKEPFVSILVPVYNQEKKLHRALMSIDNATSKSACKDIQVILYDDGSTDSSSYIMHDWEENRRRDRSQQDIWCFTESEDLLLNFSGTTTAEALECFPHHRSFRSELWQRELCFIW